MSKVVLSSNGLVRGLSNSDMIFSDRKRPRTLSDILTVSMMERQMEETPGDRVVGSRLAPGPNEQKWRQRPDARWTTTRLTRPIPASPSPCPASVHLQHRLPYNHQHVPCASWSQERHARDRNRPYVLTSTRAVVGAPHRRCSPCSPS